MEELKGDDWEKKAKGRLLSNERGEKGF